MGKTVHPVLLVFYFFLKSLSCSANLFPYELCVFYFVILHDSWHFGICKCHIRQKVVLVVKNLPANAGDKRYSGSIAGLRRSPGGRHGNPSTPVFLPGESHGQRSLVGYSPKGGKESELMWFSTCADRRKGGLSTDSQKISEKGKTERMGKQTDAKACW